MFSVHTYEEVPDTRDLYSNQGIRDICSETQWLVTLPNTYIAQFKGKMGTMFSLKSWLFMFCKPRDITGTEIMQPSCFSC